MLAGYIFMRVSTDIAVKKIQQAVTKQQQSIKTANTIQDALSKSQSLKCAFSDSSGRNFNIYVKSGAVRADIAGKNEGQPYNNVSLILENQKIYIWDNNSKQGTVTSMTSQTSQIPNAPGLNLADMIASVEKFRQSCKQSSVDDALMLIPSDVSFSQGQVQQQTQQMQYQQQSQSSSSGGY